ncbi:bifunctional histidinal dehydrogenase/ histidinol dehydrogenase [Halogeometricum borinquense DSM 11551]|uniref:Histidinol dehydrogenase n=1 Tax=Halogeometricum borinquense (strain ATCC 700274 / DSM 11551 / JCM 10706 / KCTC 4070 / PR3) TaxID=469382 RepID=E4NQN4_HALBP|nr:histidinol dehydrogenase [Halogeometricum borinquense]ADQ66722.1 histidinol dehydrogenase [Halogeometricum borinquense DSM 11551]ELY30231.1 bifunctional histidinal dehydrogenase/ histidinol dehydrogenase [Halogeometricum borinquense DSM 11551]
MQLEVREVAELSPDERVAFFERDAGVTDVQSDVRDIVSRVRNEGDVAIRNFCREFDDVEVGNLDVTDDAERAYEEIDDDVRESIEAAAANIREFHERQLPDDWRETFDGLAGDADAASGEQRAAGTRELGRRFRPLERVGVYAPGGTAAYPSSVLMGVVPAKVAGVEHVAVVTPPGDPMNPITLAAAHVAGADRIYSVGGAQAVSALAYGTETVKAVQKVVGPGNKWVTAAKAEVRGDVDIDFLAGPSEILVVADETADPAFVAADLVAQAEHDPNASVVAVTDDADTAEAILAAVERQIAGCEREETIREAFENDASGVLVTRSMSEAVLFAEEYAAEHLSIQAEDDEALLDRISNAGSVFLGPHTPVAAGDYASGTNHVLPTSGGAKRYGGLSVETFLRSTTVQRLDEGALSDLSETITTLAEAEGLEAHAESVRTRLEDE